MIRLDENHFSAKSSASRILVQALKQAGDEPAARKTTQQWQRYMDGLQQILRTDQPFRNELLKLWEKAFLEDAEKRLKPLYERSDLPFGEYINLIVHRRREAQEHGHLMEKMRS